LTDRGRSIHTKTNAAIARARLGGPGGDTQPNRDSDAREIAV